MAKLGLLFVAVFCIVQLSLAARLPRETEVESTTGSDFFGKIGEGLQQFGKEIQGTFTKENADKFWEGTKDNAKKLGDSLSDTSKKIGDSLTDFGKDVQNKYEDLTKEAEKKL